MGDRLLDSPPPPETHFRGGVNIGQQEYAHKIDYAKVETIKGATWVGDLCLRAKDGGWTTKPFMVFWQPHPKQPHHKHYFAVHFDGFDQLLITSGMSAAEGVWIARESQEGEIIFSRFRHDYRATTDHTLMIDGGRDYCKTRGPYRRGLLLRLAGPQFVEVPHEDSVVALWEDAHVVARRGGDSVGGKDPTMITRATVETWCETWLEAGSWQWITDAVLRVGSQTDLALFRLNFD